MIRALVSFSARRHGAISALTALLLIAGIAFAARARLDVFPDFVPSQVDIQTEAPGFAPQQVEQLFTRPIESAIGGVTGLTAMRSESIPGLSIITVSFGNSVDPHVARQEVAERLAEAIAALPPGTATPKLSPLVSSTMDLLKIGLVSDRLDAYALRDAAEWVLKPRLLAVPGVAHVILFGGSSREIQVLPNPDRLASFGITLSDLEDALRASLRLSGTGFIDTPEQRILLESPTPRPLLEPLRQTVITTRGSVPLRIADVADVREGPALKAGDALIMGRPGVLLSLASQYGANTLTTTLAVEKVLASVAPALKAQGITVYPALHRPANFIERALHDLAHSLLVSAALILIVLFLFLRNVRAALIAFLAIPLSLLAAVAALNLMGRTIDTMTLGGFAVALGVLVDDAIIGIENVLRRLRQQKPAGFARLDVIREASLEVRGPVVFATVVVILVFLPELFSTSLAGKFLGPLALAFILAVSASLIVAMTTTTALSALLLKPEDLRPEPRWLTRLKVVQSRAIEIATRRIGIIAITLAVLFLASLAMLPFIGGTFMPDFREGHFVMQVSSRMPGLSLEEMRRLGTRISADVLKLPYVYSVEQQIGRAELGEDAWGTHQSELHVELRPDASIDQREAQDALRRIVEHYPGLQAEVVTFLGDRISESLTGETAQIAIKIFGSDLHELDATADQIIAAASRIEGVRDLQFRRESGTPTYDISITPEALSQYGITLRSALDAVHAAYAGEPVGQTYAGIRSVPVTLLLAEALRTDPAGIGRLPIATPFGPVPLGQIAHLTPARNRYNIEHDGGQRRVSVTFNVRGRALQSVAGDVSAAISRSVRLPAGTTIEYAGAAAAGRETRNQILLYSLLATAAIVLVLRTAFHWRAHGWLVLANLPFSLIGGILAIVVTGIGISLGAVVGLVTVFGISARNAILQLAHYEHLVEVEHSAWDLPTLERGANERLIPILMTATVTALGLAPLAVGIHEPGQEIGGPMAVVVLGGLVTSTLLNLFVLPSFAWRFVRQGG